MERVRLTISKMIGGEYMNLQLNEDNVKLCNSLEKLPRCEDMIPIYMDILKNTSNAIVRNEMAYILSNICPDNQEYKTLLVSLINSPKTENAKGGLIYALNFLDYTDDESILALLNQIVNGNYECRYKSFDMLKQLIIDDKVINKGILKQQIEEQGELLAERLDLLEELYNENQEN